MLQQGVRETTHNVCPRAPCSQSSVILPKVFESPSPADYNTYGFIWAGYHFSPLSFLTLFQSYHVVFSGRLSSSVLEIVCFDIKPGERPCLSSYSGAQRRLQEFTMPWFQFYFLLKSGLRKTLRRSWGVSCFTDTS